MRRDGNRVQHVLATAGQTVRDFIARTGGGASRSLRFWAMACAGVLVLPAGAAHAASFDCATATAPAEKVICDNRGLNDQDVKMATLYEVLTHMVAMGRRGELQDAQRAWLKGRAQCKGDIACLRTAYESRIHTLQQALEDIYSRGPY